MIGENCFLLELEEKRDLRGHVDWTADGDILENLLELLLDNCEK